MRDKAENYYKSIKDHVLHKVSDDPIRAFYLRPVAGGRIMSTLILFTPEGIVLMGDLTPGIHGTISSFGYGEAWFASKLSSDYLCGKFLRCEWQHALAEEWMRDRKRNAEYYGDDFAEKVADLADEFDDRGVEWLADELNELGYDLADGVPGMGYDPNDAGWLIAIQRRFAECIEAHKESK